MESDFRSLCFQVFCHCRRLVTDKWYRTLFRLETTLGNRPRYEACEASFNGWKLRIPDPASFLSTFEELFVKNIYAFRFPGNAPRILDVGANIGLSVLFFKKLYPDAVITAFEPDPHIFEYLVANVHGNGFEDVQLRNVAAWHTDAILKFSSDGADGGHLSLAGESGIDVQAVNLSRFLSGHKIDFLKMDIEGAEDTVFPACADSLGEVSHVFIEYHASVGKRQGLDRILATLSDSGFRFHLHCGGKSPAPFTRIELQSGFDLQVDIFAWKDQGR